VSSALAVPLAAGIPLTHRGTSTAFHVITGHGGLDEAATVALRERSGTVVVLMGVSMLPEIVRQALASGVAPTTPVAVVENGTLETQRVTRAPLDGIAVAAAQAGVRAPAVIVLGDVAAADLLETPLADAGETSGE
jgi:uroporphyrin-III C-methyltransferase/precorrin-2 dehydrogenase/sirohydrochlorin ferrochelatase